MPEVHRSILLPMVTERIMVYVKSAIHRTPIRITTTRVLEIMATVRDRQKTDGAWWPILGGVLAILFGLLLLIAPLAFGQLIVRVLGFYTILFGVALIALAFGVRGVAKGLGKAEQ